MQRTLLTKLLRLFQSRAPGAGDDGHAPLPPVSKSRRGPPPIPSDAIPQLDSGVITLEVERQQ